MDGKQIKNKKCKVVCSYPMIFADVPDPYICRKGNTFYMLSTTMFMSPGVPIAKSTDLVHWQIVRYVYDILEDDDLGNLRNGKDMYARGSWAGSIIYDERTDLFYVCFNTRDHGTFFYTIDDIENGEWKMYKAEHVYHDPGLLMENGKLYVFSNYCCGDLSVVELIETKQSGEKDAKYIQGKERNIKNEEIDNKNEVINTSGNEEKNIENNIENNLEKKKCTSTKSQMVGIARQIGETKRIIESAKYRGTEGWHISHIGKYYYLFAIASPKETWYRTQLCYRSQSLKDGDWEEMAIYTGHSGGYHMQGLAQGGLIDTKEGKYYGYFFQDHESVGRCPSVVGVNFHYVDENGQSYEDWPMIGSYDEQGNFHFNQSKKSVQLDIEDSFMESELWGDDDFDYAPGESLKKIWQWNHNPDPKGWSVTERKGYYRITTLRKDLNIFFARNTLTQRTFGPKCTSETALSFNGMKDGDYAGLCAFQDTYGLVGIKCEKGEYYIVQGQGKFERDEEEKIVKRPVKENAKIHIEIPDAKNNNPYEILLRISYDFSYTEDRISDMVYFYYSLDKGENFYKIGEDLKLTNNYLTLFMGTRSALFMYSTKEAGGFADFDYYKIYE